MEKSQTNCQLIGSKFIDPKNLAHEMGWALMAMKHDLKPRHASKLINLEEFGVLEPNNSDRRSIKSR